MTTQELSGVLAVVQTPFDEDDAIDEDVFRAQVDWLFDNGARGVTLGMVSEILRLSTPEREQLVELTCSAAGDRGPVVVSVGAESSVVAARQAAHAESSGATAVMATPPALTQVSDRELFRYFAAIADATTAPVIVQDASNYVGSPLSIGFQARLYHELGPRIMFKPESSPVGPRLSQLLESTDGGARVFEGSGGLYLIDGFRRGAVGTMPAGDLVWALSALWESLVAGDYERAYRVGGPLAMLIALQGTLDSYVSVEKYILHKQGVFPSTRMRGPVAESADPQTYLEIDRLFDALKATVHG